MNVAVMGHHMEIIVSEHDIAKHKLGIVAYRRHIAELKAAIAMADLGGETIGDNGAVNEDVRPRSEDEVKAYKVLLYRRIIQCERSIEKLAIHIADGKGNIRCLRRGLLDLLGSTRRSSTRRSARTTIGTTKWTSHCSTGIKLREPRLGGVLFVHERGPSRHQLAPLLEQVATGIRRFRLVLDGVGKCGFHDRVRRVRLLRCPIAERAAKPVGGGVDAAVTRELAYGGVGQNFAVGRRKR